MREPKDDHERKAIADIQNHGWHVLKVMEDSKGPAFAYTVGLHHSFGHPELIIVGLPLDVGHSVLNVAGESIRRGVQYAEGLQSDDFLREPGVPVSEDGLNPSIEITWDGPSGSTKARPCSGRCRCISGNPTRTEAMALGSFSRRKGSRDSTRH